MSDVEELWHNDRNIIITAKKQVNAQQCFQYLRKNMSSFSKESKFFIITGHHHDGLDESNVAVVGATDSGLNVGIASAWECLNKELKEKCKNDNCGKKCDNCVWQDKQFSIERFSVDTNDYDNEDGINKPSETSLGELNEKFEDLRLSRKPVVFVYASCWSHYSPINTILRAHGLYAVLTLKKERSDLTIEHVFKLDKEQEEYLKMVVDDSQTKKDLIIAGKYFLV